MSEKQAPLNSPSLSHSRSDTLTHIHTQLSIVCSLFTHQVVREVDAHSTTVHLSQFSGTHRCLHTTTIIISTTGRRHVYVHYHFSMHLECTLNTLTNGPHLDTSTISCKITRKSSTVAENNAAHYTHTVKMWWCDRRVRVIVAVSVHVKSIRVSTF